MRFTSVAVLVLLACVLASAMGFVPLPGGASDIRPADPVVEDIVAGATPQILSLTGVLGVSAAAALAPVEYRAQVVAGTNFFVKIATTNSAPEAEFIACRFFRPLPPNHKQVEVVKCQAIAADEHVNYF